MRIYSILDVKVREYGPLVLCATDEACRRALREGVPNSGSTMAKYPEDFHVYAVGSFNVETGVLTPLSVPRLVDQVANVLGVHPSGGES